MADRKDFYFRQVVREADLDQSFDFVESAAFNLTVDNGLVGIQSGMTVAQTVVPSLNVQIAGGVAYSKQGERINIVGTQVLDISVDENAITTDPGTGGFSIVISIFAEFDRALGSPEVDGNSQTVYTLRAESYKFIVRKGGEASSPGGGAEEAFINANAVPQDGALIRICDIIRAQGQTAIVDANIFTTVLREDAFVYSIGTLGVRVGTIKEADEANLQLLNDHINQLSNGHDATSIAYDPADLPIPGTYAQLSSAVTVQAAIDGLVTDLQQTGVTNPGASHLGFYGTGAQWRDLTALASTNVNAAIREVVTSIATSGAIKSGFSPTGLQWATGGVIPDTDVQAAIARVYNDLGGATGDIRVGSSISNLWADGSAITGPTNTVAGSLAAITGALGSSAGADKVGLDPAGTALTGSVDTVLLAVQDLAANWGKKSLANTWSLLQTFTSGGQFNGAVNVTDSAFNFAANLVGDRVNKTHKINTHVGHTSGTKFDNNYTHFLTFARETSATASGDIIFTGKLSEPLSSPTGRVSQLIITYSAATHDTQLVTSGLNGSFRIDAHLVVLDDDLDDVSSSTNLHSASYGTNPPIVSTTYAAGALTLGMSGNSDTNPIGMFCFAIVLQYDNDVFDV